MIETCRSEGSNSLAASRESLAMLTLRVRGEYAEMPGLHLTVPQAARLFGVGPDVAHAVLETLRQASVLTCSVGKYSLLDT